MDFSINKYKQFVQFLKDFNIPVYGLLQWHQKQPDFGVLLEHHVDKRPENSLKIAKIEHKFGISSTYFYRSSKKCFKSEILSNVSKLGHEIGYHYNDYTQNKGDIELTKKSFSENLNKFRKITQVFSVAMYGIPNRKFDARKMWENFILSDFDLKVRAYIEVDYSDIYYFADTGRTWSSVGNNINDKVVSNRIADIKTTDDLIDFIKNNKDKKIAVVIHPKRWSDGIIEHFYVFFKDLIIRTFKKTLMIFR
ncbi:MAG: hypothetical protein JXR68_05045 [Bacteroidales bacterium]|nr:hypothetical protein [Bacteroidales bacterium]